MPLTVGENLGPYEILAPIGAGGMGEVYRARDTQLDREVAIKVLPSAVARDPDRFMRFEREAKVLAAEAIRRYHPNRYAVQRLRRRAGVCGGERHQCHLGAAADAAGELDFGAPQIARAGPS